MQTLALGPTSASLCIKNFCRNTPKLNGNIQKTWHLRATDTAPPSNVVKETYVIILCYAVKDAYSSHRKSYFSRWKSQVYTSHMLWNGFFSPALKESADVSGALWYEKFNLKGWEREWCLGLFSFSHTKRYENDVLLWGGNDANRTAEKFLHNSIQFPPNPNGGLQFQRGGVGERWRDCEGGREGVTDARWEKGGEKGKI